MRFWNWPYRQYLWLNRYLRVRDFLQLGMALAVLILTLNTTAESQRVATGAGVAYLLLLVLYTMAAVRTRVARDRVQGEVLSGLFHHLNQEVFGGDSRTRFTLFRRAPLRQREIIPWYRYRRACDDAITEARRSRAHYQRGEGITGLAWEKPGELWYKPLPNYAARQDFEDSYVGEFGIRPRVVKDLSEYMEKVQTIFSYGFEDARGRLLGILSLDLQPPLTQSETEGKLLFASDDPSSEPTEIDTSAMLLILSSVRNVLESFSLSQRED